MRDTDDEQLSHLQRLYRQPNSRLAVWHLGLFFRVIFAFHSAAKRLYQGRSALLDGLLKDSSWTRSTQTCLLSQGAWLESDCALLVHGTLASQGMSTKHVNGFQKPSLLV